MSDNTLFWRFFARRSLICFMLVMLLFLSCILRVAVAATSDYAAVQQSQSSIRMTLGELRGTIYDCNMIPITNSQTKIIAAVSPTPRAITAISKVLTGEEKEAVLETLKNGKPALCEVEEAIDCDGIVCTEIFEHNSSDTLAVHTIGYTDSDNSGVTGIEAAYDDILYTESKAQILYSCDGLGRILEGIEPTVINDTSKVARGVVTTLDLNIQSIAESSAEAIESGAVVVADAESGKIRAIVSRPDFDCTDVSKYLTAESSPLFNRAVNAYSVGSVFKPCVAAAGLEAGNSSFSYTCTGSCKIVDRIFKCHNHSGHGLMNLKSGIANSCNTFFYNFAFSVGGNEIYKMASSLMFGKSINLFKDFHTASGSLPKLQSLQNIAYLANFSIGQGELLLSPVSMLTLYLSIANDGCYRVPSIIEGTVEDGAVKQNELSNPTRVMSKETSRLLREYLTAVITEGTGKQAQPETVTAAGKTATAQTGKYENGTEICAGWFCGFFPAEDPEYAVIVFSEDSKKQTKSCAEIFAEIADQITSVS